MARSDLAPSAIPVETAAMRTHAAVEVVHGRLRAEVDEELAPLVLEIWRAGFPTIHSCQDMGENIADVAREAPHLGPLAARLAGRANIGFSEPALLVGFYEALANAGPRNDFYERMMHWASPQAWELTIGMWDWGLEADLDDPDPDRADGSSPSRVSAASFQVRFPSIDVSETTTRMQRHNRGERVHLGTRPGPRSASRKPGAEAETPYRQVGAPRPG